MYVRLCGKLSKEVDCVANYPKKLTVANTCHRIRPSCTKMYSGSKLIIVTSFIVWGTIWGMRLGDRRLVNVLEMKRFRSTFIVTRVGRVGWKALLVEGLDWKGSWPAM